MAEHPDIMTTKAEAEVKRTAAAVQLDIAASIAALDALIERGRTDADAAIAAARKKAQFAENSARTEARSIRLTATAHLKRTLTNVVAVADWAALSRTTAVPASNEVPRSFRFGELLNGSAPLVMAPFRSGGLLVAHPDRDALQGVVDGFLLGLLLNAPASQLRIDVFDPRRLGRTVSACAPAARSIEGLQPLAIMTDERALMGVLDEYRQHAASVIERYVGGSTGTLADVVEQSGRPVEPFRLLVIADSEPNDVAALRTSIDALCDIGPTAGIAILVVHEGSQRPEWLAAGKLPELVDDGRGWRYRWTSLDLPAALTEPPGKTADAVHGSISVGQRLADVLPPESEWWTATSAHGLEVCLGAEGLEDLRVTFNDDTVHALIGGGTGSGKSNMLQVMLYGLATRYSPDEFEVFLLDFKEGLEFMQCAPSSIDETFLPHARYVSVKAERDIGMSVLQYVRGELQRRAASFKQVGATKLTEYRERSGGARMPRIIVLIDEFQVQLSPRDDIAEEAADLLERIAREGRSYGVHLLLATQGISGIQVLASKGDAIFDQFKLRMSMSISSNEARNILGNQNNPTDQLTTKGRVVVNRELGDSERHNEFGMVAYAPDEDRLEVRTKLWQMRALGTSPPAVVRGDEHADLLEGLRRWSTSGPLAMPVAGGIGVDEGTVSVDLTRAPGRNVAVIGRADTGAWGTVQAATLGLATRCPQGRFVLVGAPVAELRVLREALQWSGASVEAMSPAQFLRGISQIADEARVPGRPTFLIIPDADALGAMTGDVSPSEMDDEDIFTVAVSHAEEWQRLLRDGPMSGTHVVARWRSETMLEAQVGYSADALFSVQLLLDVSKEQLFSATGETGQLGSELRVVVVDRPSPLIRGIAFGACVDATALSKAVSG
jgi:S-DNA-T family DNA segregation ATPase FtsK/SpoIIIE